MNQILFMSLINLILLSSILCQSSLAQSSISLEVSDSARIEVQANQRINKTAIWVEKGHSYQIIARGKWQDADFDPTDANGFVGFTKAMKFGNFLKPKRKENYMKLLARVRRKTFAVGTDTTFTPKRSGRLRFITNDAKLFFGNNSGSLQVTIARID